MGLGGNDWVTVTSVLSSSCSYHPFMLSPTPRSKNPPYLVALPHAIWLLVGTTLASSLPGAHAYSWNLRDDARQCTNSTVVLNGSGGKPPYKLLMIPFGASPLSVEARRIVEQVFIADGDQTSGEIKVSYPANSQFVAVVSRSFSPLYLFFPLVHSGDE